MKTVPKSSSSTPIVQQGGPPAGASGSSEFNRQRYARNLLQAMAAKNMRQADLARRLNTGRDTVNGYARARVLPSPAQQEKIARILGVTVEALNPSFNEQPQTEAFPSIELKQSVLSPGKAWLRINKEVSFQNAAKVIAILQEDEGS